MKKVNKKLASAIVLGLMMSVPFSASAEDVVLEQDTTYEASSGNTYTNISGKTGEESITFKGIGSAQAISASSGNEKSITNIKDIDLTGKWSADPYSADASVFYTNGENSKLTINISGDLTRNDSDENAEVFHAMGGDIIVNANSINIANSIVGICAQKNGVGASSSINIDVEKDVMIKSVSTTVYAGTLNEGDVVEGSKSIVDITAGNNIQLESTMEGGCAVGVYGRVYDTKAPLKNQDKVILKAGNVLSLKGDTAIFVQNGIDDEKMAEVSAHGKNIFIDGNITAENDSKVTIGGDFDIDGKEVTFDKATITGDITATNNSTVDINLGNGGIFTGSVNKPSEEARFAAVNADASKVSINMGSGSVWNVTDNSTVSTISGVGTIKLDVEKIASVKIDNDNSDKLTIAAKQNADDVKDANVALEAMAKAVDGEKVGTVVKVNEGILNGEVSGTTSADGGVANVHQNGTTTTMGNMRDLASVALIAWRQEDSTLSQRLGELRNSEGDQGIWARMSRGEFEYDGAFKNQYNYFQMGYDWAADDWHYGAAISHNDGQTTYANGNGENDSTSLTLYGTWLGDKGQYTDIVVKQGKLNNEFTNYAEAGVTKADYDMWGTSISAEYGQKLELKNDWYVTPQAQLTYMVIGDEDYTATVDGAPMQVSQDSMDSVVGRVGFEAGKHISDKGSIYAKASLLHEFTGEADTYMQLGETTNSYTQDLGDTWYECGIGVNYKTSDNSYVYADVVKTFGGDVETPWQWNAGMRFTF